MHNFKYSTNVEFFLHIVASVAYLLGKLPLLVSVVSANISLIIHVFVEGVDKNTMNLPPNYTKCKKLASKQPTHTSLLNNTEY